MLFPKPGKMYTCGQCADNSSEVGTIPPNPNETHTHSGHHRHQWQNHHQRTNNSSTIKKISYTLYQRQLQQSYRCTPNPTIDASRHRYCNNRNGCQPPQRNRVFMLNSSTQFRTDNQHWQSPSGRIWQL